MLRRVQSAVLAVLATGMAAPSAHAAGDAQLLVSVFSPPQGVQLLIYPTSGTALNTTVAGTSAGVVTITDAGGLSLGGVPGAPCTVVSATTVTCGVPGAPVSYLTVNGGSQPDRVDLSALAAQDTSSAAFRKYPAETEVDLRMRGVFAVVNGGGGADDITGGGAGARIEPGDGDDTVRGGPGDELFRAGGEPTDGADVFSGGGGYDTLSYAARTASVSGTLDDGVTTGLGGGLPGGENDSVGGVESLVGGKGDDTLTIAGQLGSVGTLSGGAGNDTLTGGPGPDKLTGGSGKDELFGGDGDDQLVDPGGEPAFAVDGGNLPGHLHGGGGDDELFQQSSAMQKPFSDGAPTCGTGTDVLRADPGIDEGVGLYAGPADCEVLATVGTDGGSTSTITPELRVGKAASVVPATSLLGTPLAGRMESTTWEICTNQGVCELRVTEGPSITFLPTDAGKHVFSARVRVREPLSQHPRWIEERAASETYVPSVIVARGSEAATILGAETVEPPVAPSTKPDAAAALRALQATLGSKPKLRLLAKSKSVSFAAPAGSTVKVGISLKVGKKAVLLSRGAATADAKGRAAVVLKPTKAGKKAAKAGKKLTAVVELTAAAKGSSAVARGKLKLRP